MPSEHLRPDQGNEEQRQQLAALLDKDFVVKRSDGTLETGWEIQGVTEDTNGNLRVVIVDKKHDLTKPGVLASDLLSWQSAPEDEAVEDTIPNPTLWNHLETAEVPNDVPQGVREELGEEAIAAVGINPLETVSMPETAERKLPTIENAKERINNIISKGFDTSPLAEQLGMLGSTPDKIIAGLGDAEARGKVRNILQTRLHMLLDSMPRQIRDGAVKNVAHPKRFGYPEKMSSRDYAVEIALAYLDGSFETRGEELSGLGAGGIGEHRTAAQQLLESFVPESSEEGEKLAFHDDRLATYEREMYARMSDVANELDRFVLSDGSLNPEGVLQIIKEQLDSPYVNTEEASQEAIRMKAKFEEVLDTLTHELGMLQRLQGELAPEDADDIEKAEQMRIALLTAINGIDEARNSWLAAHLEGLIYQNDQMYLMQLQNTLRQNGLEEQIGHPLVLARQQLTQLGI